MTHPSLGRAPPIHFDMANLAGWGNNNPKIEDYMADDEDYDFIDNETIAVNTICHGRAGLIRTTLRDFGFDLERWRLFFLEDCADAPIGSEEYGGWGYSRSSGMIEAIVLGSIDREQRPHLEALAKAAWPEQLMSSLAWHQKWCNDPEEPLWLAAVEEWPFD